jgi:prepilin-type N-terminal cleavage/methylation domain-containing protein
MPEQRGFTLIELLVTFTVLAIILGIGVPGLRDFIFNNRQVSALNEMVASLQYGRTEAIARNNTVSLCPSTNGTSCTGASTWDVGWIIFSDSDAWASTTTRSPTGATAAPRRGPSARFACVTPAGRPRVSRSSWIWPVGRAPRS